MKIVILICDVFRERKRIDGFSTKFRIVFQKDIFVDIFVGRQKYSVVSVRFTIWEKPTTYPTPARRVNVYGMYNILRRVCP